MKILKKDPKKWKLFRQVQDFPIGWDDDSSESIREKRTVYLDYYNGGYSYEKANVDEMDNFIFEDTIYPERTYRGRSAAGFILTDKDKNQFTMRLQKTSDLIKAIIEGRIVVANGGLKGHWTFAKQGANYSLAVAGVE